MARVSTETRLRRILAMVPWVVARDGPTVAEVCERFGLSAADLASDIELLYLCGLHPYTPDMLIEATISDGRVWIGYADYFRRPLRLTPAEGLGLVAAASTLLAAPGTDSDGPLARGLAKLAAAIGGGADTVGVSLAAVEPEVLAGLRDAAERGRQVEVDYYNFGRDERGWRTIEPAGVFSATGHWYVSAYCHHAGDARTFRVDRIVELRPTELPRTGPTVDAEPGLFTRRPSGGTVVLELDPIGAWVAEQYPVEDVRPGPSGSLRVTLAVTEWTWLDRLLLRLGPHARVISAPPEWPGVAPTARRILARYSPPHDP